MTNPNARNPYANLPADAFWRTAVAGRDMDTLGAIHRPKFAIDRSTKIALAGSCFAQQIGRHLRARGFSVLDMEPAPPGLTPEEETLYGFGLYSARYGNIYTARQLRQLAEEAFGLFRPGEMVWEKDGRFYDALRPTIEPDGLGSAQAVREQRRHHLRRVRQLICHADVFLFTLGLSETWTQARTGAAYPTAPGVVCGEYRRGRHRLVNLTAQEVHADLTAFLDLARQHNPRMKLVLTVSPQRPTATATGKHVLTAAGYSKAVLRAAAGQLESEHHDVDYFPSFEMVTSPIAGNRYFNPNLRTVTAAGAALAMEAFFAAYAGGAQDEAPPPPPPTKADARDALDEAACDEELLDAFAP